MTVRAREYFEAVRSMEREIRRRIWAVEAAEANLYRTGGSGGGAACAHSGDPSWRVADGLTAYDAAARAYVASVDELAEAEHEAYAYIRAVKDAPNGDNMMDALQLRYVCLLDNDEVARRMGCTVRTLQRWVDQAFDWYDTLRFFERNPPRWL